MALITTLEVAPLEEPINEREAKEHMRIEIGDTGEDEYIKTLITAAREQVEHITGRALLDQTWSYYLNEWPEGNEILLPRPPLIWTPDASYIKYTDSGGTETTLVPPPGTAAVTAELITNGGMEIDANWINYNTPTSNIRSGAQKRSGNFSRLFTSNGANDGIQGAVFATETDITYTFVAWVYPDDDTRVGIKIRHGDNSGWLYDAEHLGLTENAWNRITFDVTDTLGGGGAYVVFEDASGATGDWYIDDVSFRATAVVSDYVVDTDREPGRIVLSYGQSWPSTTMHPRNPIHIYYDCGWVNPEDVPASLKVAMKLLIADMYENRETKIIGVSVSTLKTVDRLLDSYVDYTWKM